LNTASKQKRFMSNTIPMKLDTVRGELLTKSAVDMKRGGSTISVYL
jgi:hypothetical protein